MREVRAGAMRSLPSELPAQGFTLLELMLVLVIVAVLAAVVVPGFTGASHRRQVQAEAERLALAVEVARAEALRRNEIWGLAVSESAYSFKRHDAAAAAWEDIERRPFSTHSAQAGVNFAVAARFDHRLAPADEADRHPVGQGEDYDPWAGQRQEGDRGQRDRPAVAIYPSGEITPFDVVVFSADTPAWIARSDGIGRARATPARAVEEPGAELALLLRAAP